MKNFIKGLVVGVATLSSVVGITMATTTEVKAEEALYEQEAVVTKEIKIPEGITVPNLKFDFTAEGLGTEETDGTVTPDATQPEWLIPSIEFSKNSEPADVGGTGNKAIKSTGNLMTTIKGLSFTHAGVYQYRVTETPGSDAVITHYSQAEYLVRVYVENVPDEEGGGVVVKGITVQKVKNDNNSPNGSKVNPSPDTFENSEFRFVNEFWDDTNLVIEKKVVGDSADLTKVFNFEITLNLPTVVTAPTGHKVTYTVGSDSTVVEYTGTNPINVKLKHGEKITFANLPVGSTYKVVEKGEKSYEPTAKVTGRGTNGSAVDGKAGVDYTVTVGAVNNLLVEAEDETTKNKTLVTNTFKSPSITGVITDNLPFVLMVAVAGAGIVFLTISKRRRAQ
ncbi:DUF7601 domain-containing protein [Enterococcus sp. DIV0756]|uniref:DUF7601 domain-containing protein n=1 Tax=Enterococcus sp. DIV0756 TaxID=2774636 RepID=UPI003F25701A